MSTIDAYGVKFIGNDMVAPKNKRPQNVAPVQHHRFVAKQQPAPVQRAPKAPQAQPVQQVQPVEAVPEPELALAPAPVAHAEEYSEPAPVKRRASTPRFTFSRRTVAVALSGVVVLGVAAYTVPHASAISHKASTLTASINTKLHPSTQPSFTMPAHAVLVKTGILSNYEDAVESQSIVLTIGTNTVTPLPNDIAGWIKASNGPEKGTTLLTVNESTVSSYVSTAVQNSIKSSPMLASSVTPSDESAAVNQIAKELLKYNGVTVTIDGSTPAPANQ